MSTNHPSLGPHEGIELELMLANKKDLSLFYTDSEIPKDFFPLFKAKKLFFRTISFPNALLHNENYMDFKMHIISKNENCLKADRLEHLLKISFRPGQSIIEIEREIGELLGYEKHDIDFYINHRYH
ncbi:hemocin immunity protein [Acinetobacter sp. B5B]|uniref:hemocin immunity protein n=1 Tax=Acinetobacter baretiae TaxID=2605383 RepID=UPI0018C272AC|nr:hemocin immunity protein [Acinetobacter baretiae]MBF7683674.1 hemocin immunity protein [Acinetobacter baretiae]MBF7686499.1 hemocin immunity protein [Acinetobacter baretiae]